MAPSDPTDIPKGVPGERADALYGLPLGDFTSSRDALVRELRQAGQRQQADWVGGLRKPSAAAWVVNQLARTQARERGRLLDAGQKLRRAHERLLAGDAGADELRRAADQEAEAVRALLARAPGLLDGAGHSPSRSTLEKAEQTLHAVALDEQTRAAFEAGRLTRERRATGLGPLDGPGRAAETPRKRGASGKRKRAREGSQRRAGPSPAARRALKEAKDEQRARRRAVVSAERELGRASRDAERAQRRLEEATSELEGARAAEAEAQARVADAQAAVERA